MYERILQLPRDNMPEHNVDRDLFRQLEARASTASTHRSSHVSRNPSEPVYRDHLMTIPHSVPDNEKHDVEACALYAAGYLRHRRFSRNRRLPVD